VSKYERKVDRLTAEKFADELINCGAGFVVIPVRDEPGGDQFTIRALTGTENEVAFDQAAYSCGLKRKPR
jgi:hypothetical protein